MLTRANGDVVAIMIPFVHLQVSGNDPTSVFFLNVCQKCIQNHFSTSLSSAVTVSDRFISDIVFYGNYIMPQSEKQAF
jgi:hypothetical protein